MVPGAGLVAGIGSAVNAISQAFTNSSNRRHQRKMYNLQRQDYLADRDHYEMYNSPVAQAERYKAAGWNPHLLLGSQGSPGETPSPGKANAYSANAQAPQIGSALAQYYDYEMKDRQLGLLETQQTIAAEEAAYKRAQTLNLNSQTKMLDYDLGFKGEMENTYVEAEMARLDQIRANTQFTLSENERKTAMHSWSLREAAQRILEMRERVTRSKAERAKITEQLNNLRWDTRVKQLDAEFREIGLGPQDGIVQRILGRILQRSADAFLNNPKFKFGHPFGN